MSVEWCDATRGQLLSLPVREWSDTSPRYDGLAILPTGEKHASGYGLIAIVGIVGNEAVEIASRCSDDMSLRFGEGVRVDCLWPSRAMRFWSHRRRSFRVGDALSSIDIDFVPR